MAYGSGLKSGYSADPFENIEIYNLVARKLANC